MNDMIKTIAIVFILLTPQPVQAAQWLVTADLPDRELLKAWHEADLPANELIGSTVIVMLDEPQLRIAQQRGFPIQQIEQYNPQSYYLIADRRYVKNRNMGRLLWDSGVAMLYKSETRTNRIDHHGVHYLNPAILPERFWQQVFVKQIPLRSLTWSPFVQSLVDQVNADSIIATIQRLQDFGIRFLLTDSSFAASAWIKQKYEYWGLKTQYDSFYINGDSVYGYERNVIATLSGNVDTGRTLIACGHFDAVPNCPGADDNASGTAGAMEMARIFRQYGWSPSLQFAAWGSEEIGMIGSEHYARKADNLNYEIDAVMNMDMIGYMNDSNYDCCVGYTDSFTFCRWLLDLYRAAAAVYVPGLTVYEQPNYISDNTYFSEVGYPAIGTIEYPDAWYGGNPNYHHSTDSLSTLDPALLAAITKAATATVALVALSPRTVQGVTVSDMGIGTQLALSWIANNDASIDGYKICWGTTSGNYADSLWIAGRTTISDTIGGLMMDTTYYISIRAVNNSGDQSYIATEVTGTPRVIPIAPAGLTAIPMIMSMKLIWRSGEMDLTGYRIYRKIDQGSWDSLNSIPITDTMQVDSVPSQTAKYCYRIRAFDVDGNASPLSDSIDSYTYVPVGLSATPVTNGIKLNWSFDSTKNIAGYLLSRKINQGIFDSLDQTLVPNTNYIDSVLSGANKYYYRLRVFDDAGNSSRLSDSVYGRPITLDQGVLVIDETNNWISGSFPRDAQQDSFYEYLLEGYQHQQYDFGGTAQKPGLVSLGPYSTIVWHSDDPLQFLAYNDSGALREYLGHGGKLWFTGWKSAADIRNSATYPVDFTAGSLLYDGFRISHAELSGATDSFKTAIGLRGYPDISVDTAKYPATIWGKVLRNMETYVPAGGAGTIYAMDMKNNGSAFEGRACAVRDSGRIVLFGFPLYYMNRDQARLATQKVMAEFGEPYGVAGKPASRISKYELWLEQSRPNPFSKATLIKFQLPQAGMVELSIYNIIGQRVKTLVSGHLPAGIHASLWNGLNEWGMGQAAGVYFVRLKSGQGSMIGKMLKLKY